MLILVVMTTVDVVILEISNLKIIHSLENFLCCETCEQDLQVFAKPVLGLLHVFESRDRTGLNCNDNHCNSSTCSS